MDIDLDLYQHEVRVSTSPLVRLSVIDIRPIIPSGPLCLSMVLGGKLRDRVAASIMTQQGRLQHVDTAGIPRL
jgi:hypothetical protein